MDFGLNIRQKGDFNNAIADKGLRMCWACSTVKPIAEFYRDGDGFQRKCRPCTTSAGVRWARENRSRHADNCRAWAKANPESIAASQRRSRQKRCDKIRDYERKRNDEFPEKRIANNAHNHEVRVGRAVSPGICSSCGKECSADAHHPDYDRPLDVVWLCRKCHTALHAEERRKA